MLWVSNTQGNVRRPPPVPPPCCCCSPCIQVVPWGATPLRCPARASDSLSVCTGLRGVAGGSARAGDWGPGVSGHDLAVQTHALLDPAVWRGRCEAPRAASHQASALAALWRGTARLRCAHSLPCIDVHVSALPGTCYSKSQQGDFVAVHFCCCIGMPSIDSHAWDFDNCCPFLGVPWDVCR